MIVFLRLNSSNKELEMQASSYSFLNLI